MATKRCAPAVSATSGSRAATPTMRDFQRAVAYLCSTVTNSHSHKMHRPSWARVMGQTDGRIAAMLNVPKVKRSAIPHEECRRGADIPFLGREPVGG